MGLPCETLSPVLTRKSFTTPAAGDGISIVALSDSTVISDCSGCTASPGLTSTSITSTFLKSPMSGTKTSLGVPMLAQFAIGVPWGGPRRCFRRALDQTVTGPGFSGSIPYFLIASETTLGLISP